MLIREDPTLDEAKAREESGDFGIPVPIPGAKADADEPTKKEDTSATPEEDSE